MVFWAGHSSHLISMSIPFVEEIPREHRAYGGLQDAEGNVQCDIDGLSDQKWKIHGMGFSNLPKGYRHLTPKLVVKESKFLRNLWKSHPSCPICNGKTTVENS